MNPFTQKGGTDQTLQMAVSTLAPQVAARWRNEARETVCLAVAAAKAGLVEMKKSVHEKLCQPGADYISSAQEATARREAELLAGQEKGADQKHDLHEK